MGEIASPTGQNANIRAVSGDRVVRSALETVALALGEEPPGSGTVGADDSDLMMRLRGHVMELLPLLLAHPRHPTGLVEYARRMRDEPHCEDPADLRVQLRKLARITRKIINEIQVPGSNQVSTAI
ncbi:hypothetical protein ACFYY1_30365 [Streptomyces sp. NPDC001890]|uniref:hypothetical protein n=1 Tax=Streptomyces sp. NPDC001890 TaxID=3364620 RepID=UPI0036909108